MIRSFIARLLKLIQRYNGHLKSEWDSALQHVSLYKQPPGVSATKEHIRMLSP